MVAPLDHFNEEGRSILKWLGEDLEQITLLVIVTKQVELSNTLEVFFDLVVTAGKLRGHIVIVSLRDREELAAAILHPLDGLNDVVSPKSDVLDTSSTIEVAKLLDLRLALAISGFVNRHLDFLVKIGNNDRAESGELSVQHLVIDRPESVEVEHLLVPRSGGLHLSIGLVTDAVVDEQKIRLLDELVDRVLQVVLAEAWQESALVVLAVHEGVSRVAVSANDGHGHLTIIVLDSKRLLNGDGAAVDRLLENACGIINGESNVLDTITRLGLLSMEHLVSLLAKGRLEGKLDITIVNDVSRKIAVASLETFIGKELESETGAVKACGLFGVADPESHVIKAVEFANLRTLGGFLVINHLQSFLFVIIIVDWRVPYK